MDLWILSTSLNPCGHSCPCYASVLIVAAGTGDVHTPVHDTQECGAAGLGRDDMDDGSSVVEFRLPLAQSVAGRGGSGVLFASFH
jgi:hypothetical protein